MPRKEATPLNLEKNGVPEGRSKKKKQPISRSKQQKRRTPHIDTGEQRAESERKKKSQSTQTSSRKNTSPPKRRKKLFQKDFGERSHISRAMMEKDPARMEGSGRQRDGSMAGEESGILPRKRKQPQPMT